jgi:urease accessory protein
MATDAAAMLVLAQWLSPAYPVGAFSYSHGLEQAVEDGAIRDGDSLSDWLDVVLEHGAGRSDAVFLAAAHSAACTAAVADLDAHCRAFAVSRERRMETVQQGMAFADTTGRIWGHNVGNLCYPVAVGRAARLARLPCDLTLQMYLQALLANLTLAAVRLIPLGQTEGQRVIRDFAPQITAVAAWAKTHTPDDIGTSAFLADIAAMKHETLYSRIFRT